MEGKRGAKRPSTIISPPSSSPCRPSSPQTTIISPPSSSPCRPSSPQTTIISPPSSSPCRPSSPQNEEKEEERMEKFFALIANMRAMRDAWRTDSRKRPRKESTPWKPTFILDDFKQVSEVASPSHPLKEREASKGKEKEEEGDQNCHLDLSLSLEKHAEI